MVSEKIGKWTECINSLAIGIHETSSNRDIYLLQETRMRAMQAHYINWLWWRGSWYALTRGEIDVKMKEIELKKVKSKFYAHFKLVQFSLYSGSSGFHQNVYVWNMYVQGAISIIDIWYPIYLVTFYCAFVQAILYMNSWPFVSVFSSWTLFSSNFL